MHKPKRGERAATNARSQALRNGFTKGKKKTATGKGGGAAVGGGT